MRSCTDSRDVAAPAQLVWDLLVDVASWPTWTDSMREVAPLSPGPLGPGARVRVRQPRLPSATYTVRTLEPGRSFSWESAVPGVLTRALHRVDPDGEGCRLTLALDWSGPLAAPVGLVYGRLTRTYLRWEVQGLQRLAESRAT